MGANYETLIDNAAVLKMEDEDILKQFNSWVATIDSLNSDIINSNIVNRIIKDM